MQTGDTASGRSATDDADSNVDLWYIAAVLTALVAALHLFHPDHGLFQLLAVLVADPRLLQFDPRPLAFVLSGLALLGGLAAVRLGYERKPLYALGMVVVATYLVGYFAWHFTGHGGFLPGREPLYHGLSPVENVVTHLTTDVLAALTKLAEVALLVVLGVLYSRN